MNIVFWLIIVVAAVVLWFCLSLIFRKIGGIGLRLWNHTEKEIFNNVDKMEENENDK